MPRRNLELKVRCEDLARARQALHRLGTGPAVVEEQTDTYFHVRRGRLKLREVKDGLATLIAYERPDAPEARLSRYRLVPVPAADDLKAVLETALGVRTVVRKRREIYCWHNVRIHLDDVEGLGSFVEFEAVLSGPEEEAVSAERLQELSRVLSLRAADHLGPSYADLLGAG